MFLLFDIGGTKMRVTAASDLTSFRPPLIIDTPKQFDDGMAELERMALELTGGAPITAAAGGVAGPFDETGSFLVNAPHLPQWIGKPLRGTIEAAFNTKAYLYNDTALVGLGEAVDGAGRGQEIVAYLSISTGVGGARIVKQAIDEYTFGFEPGHQIIDLGGSTCQGCGGQGHLEAYVSGSHFKKRWGKEPQTVTDPMVWEDLAKHLAVGVYNTILFWSPSVVVLGGSMMKEVGIPLSRVEHHLAQLLTIVPKMPPLKRATLGDVGGLHGALATLRSQQSRFS